MIEETVQSYENNVFKIVKKDINEEIQSFEKQIQMLEKNCTPGYDYEDQANYISTKGRLSRKKDRLLESREKSQEPYFIHLKYSVSDPKTGKYKDENVYIGKKDHILSSASCKTLNQPGFKIANWMTPEANFYYSVQDKIYKSNGQFTFDKKNYRIDEIRKFNIYNGELLNCFTDFKDGKSVLRSGEVDPYLSTILERKRNEAQLTDIISTIQSDQNRIIRLPAETNFILQGCAGSGKTAVMLHRLSFLQGNKQLGRFNEVHILTPNQEFNKYIQNVQQTLGLNTEHIYLRSVEEYYLRLIAQYNQNLVSDPKFYQKYLLKTDLTLKNEGELNPELLKTVYSSEFFAETDRAFSGLLREAEKTFPNLFELFNPTGLLDKEVIGRVLEEWTLIQREHESEIRELKKEEREALPLLRKQNNLKKELEKFDQNRKDLITTIDEFQKSLINSDLTSSLNPFSSNANRLLKNERDRLKRQIQSRKEKLDKMSLGSRFSNFCRDNKNVEQAPYETAEAYFLKRFELLMGEEAANLCKKGIGLHWEISFLERSLEKLESFITRGFKISESRLQAFSTLLEEEIQILQNDQFRVNLIRNGNGWVFGASKLIDLISSTNQIGEAQKQVSEIETNLQKLTLSIQEITLSIFGKPVAWDELELEAEQLKNQWNWDSIFQKLILHRLPIQVRDLVSLNDVKYRFNLYLILLAQYFFFPNLEQKKIMLNIDEAQDISAGEFRLVESIYSGSLILNLYGDEMQNVYYYRGLNDWNEIELTAYLERKKLDNNYRNPIEITEYCNKNFNLSIQAIGKPSKEKDLLQEFKTFPEAIEAFQSIIESHPEENNVIIYKTKKAKETAEQFLALNYSSTNSETGKIASVLSVQEAKGMEFQNVLVLTADMMDNERFVSITRALKRLVICNAAFTEDQINPVKKLIWPEGNRFVSFFNKNAGRNQNDLAAELNSRVKDPIIIENLTEQIEKSERTVSFSVEAVSESDDDSQQDSQNLFSSLLDQLDDLDESDSLNEDFIPNDPGFSVQADLPEEINESDNDDKIETSTLNTDFSDQLQIEIIEKVLPEGTQGNDLEVNQPFSKIENGSQISASFSDFLQTLDEEDDDSPFIDSADQKEDPEQQLKLDDEESLVNSEATEEIPKDDPQKSGKAISVEVEQLSEERENLLITDNQTDKREEPNDSPSELPPLPGTQLAKTEQMDEDDHHDLQPAIISTSLQLDPETENKIQEMIDRSVLKATADLEKSIKQSFTDLQKSLLNICEAASIFSESLSQEMKTVLKISVEFQENLQKTLKSEEDKNKYES